MADKLGMLVTVGADIKPLTKGLTDAKKELAATAAVAAKTDSSLGKLGGGANQATQAMTNLGRVVQDAPFGFLGIANNLNPLLESFQRLKASTGSTKQALSALGSSLLGAGGLGFALSVASTLLVVFGDKIFSTSKKIEQATSKSKEMKDAIASINDALAKEASETLGFIAILKNEAETRERKLSAIKELNRISPEIFGNLKLEQGAVIGLDDAYKSYLKSLRNVIDAKVLQAQIERKISDLFEKQKGKEFITAFNDGMINTMKKAGNTAAPLYQKLVDDNKRAAASTSLLEQEIDGLIQKLALLSKGIKTPEIKTPGIKVKPEKISIDVGQATKISIDKEIPLSRATGSTLTPTLNLKPKINIEITPEQQKKVLDGFQALLNADAVQDIMDRTFNSAVSNLADSFANVLAGGKNAFSGLFDGLASTFAQGIKEIGRYLVETYLLIGTIQKIKFSNPAVGVAVGFALQVLGGLIQSKINKTKAFATGVRNFEGGVALVGERGPELVNLPRGAGVVPNNEMNAYGGGGNQVFIPAVSLRGSDLVIAFNRASQSMSRNS